MFDFTQLMIVAGLLFGLFAGDVVFFGDTLRVQIAVPESVSNGGFTEATAEEVFTAEAARIVRVRSLMPPPALRVTATPSVLTALAKPLSLDGVAAALQTQFGVDHLMVSGAMLAEAKLGTVSAETAVRPLTPGVKLDLVLVVTQPGETPAQLVLEQEDGDATALIRRGAAWAMEQVAPYPVVLTYALDGLQGDPDAIKHAKDAAYRLLSRPWAPDKASQIALTHDLLALIAMWNGDLSEANRQFIAAQSLPDVIPAAHSIIALNRCFLAIAMKQPSQATMLLQSARSVAARLTVPKFEYHLSLLGALVAWSNGDAITAERMLRQLAAGDPNDITVNHYLVMLLQARGAMPEAMQMQMSAQRRHKPDEGLQAIAVDLLWTDPVKGGISRRS